MRKLLQIIPNPARAILQMAALGVFFVGALTILGWIMASVSPREEPTDRAADVCAAVNRFHSDHGAKLTDQQKDSFAQVLDYCD